MQARDLALALSVISKAYPEAEVVPQESDAIRNGHFLVIQTPDVKPMIMHPYLEETLKHLGFKYSGAHGACWYAAI